MYQLQLVTKATGNKFNETFSTFGGAVGKPHATFVTKYSRYWYIAHYFIT